MSETVQDKTQQKRKNLSQQAIPIFRHGVSVVHHRKSHREHSGNYQRHASQTFSDNIPNDHWTVSTKFNAMYVRNRCQASVVNGFLSEDQIKARDYAITMPTDWRIFYSFPQSPDDGLK